MAGGIAVSHRHKQEAESSHFLKQARTWEGKHEVRQTRNSENLLPTTYFLQQCSLSWRVHSPPQGCPQVRTARANTWACGGHFSFKHVYQPITDFSSVFYDYSSGNVEGYDISLFICLANNFSVLLWLYWLSRPSCFFCQWEDYVPCWRPQGSA